MKKLSFAEKFKNYLRASYPVIYLRTHEENRAIRSLIAAVEDLKTTVDFYSWDCKNLLQKHNRNNNSTSGGTWESVKSGDFSLVNVIDNAKKIGGNDGRNIIIFKDFHHYIESPGQIRPIRNAIEDLKCRGNMFVFLSPVVKIPTELEKDMQVLEFTLPDEEQLRKILLSVVTIRNKKNLDKGLPEKPIDAAIEKSTLDALKGLAYNEAGDAVSLGIIEHKEFNEDFVSTVYSEKIKQIQRSGVVQYIETNITFDDIGGMVGLKKYIESRSKAYSDEARAYGLPFPKGILLAGIPGCGKTVLAKATAHRFKVPLLQVDMGGLFGKYVGETEENFRKLTQLTDGVGRCVLFIDEIEKSLNRSAVSGAGDSGTGSRAFATFLSWLSDRNGGAFIIVTSNDHTKLPVELTRKGRLDEMFWIDLPSSAEREAILGVMLRRYNRDPIKMKLNFKKLAEKTVGWTGAELEQLVVGTMYNRFDKDGKEFTQTDLEDEINSIVPMSITAKEDIENMRSKAVNRLRIASSSGVSRLFSGEEATARKDRGEFRQLDLS